MSARPHATPTIDDLPPVDVGPRRRAVFGGEILSQWTPRWIAQLAAPSARYVGVSRDGAPMAYCFVGHDDSWAWLIPDSDGWAVRQSGGQRLWDCIEGALAAWQSAGSPEQHAFRLRISDHEQVVFCPDSPALSWALPGL
jgi:hypothetical protein